MLFFMARHAVEDVSASAGECVGANEVRDLYQPRCADCEHRYTGL